MLLEPNFTCRKGTMDYYESCVNHAKMCGWLTTDKITISMPAGHFNLMRLRKFDSPRMSLLQFGNYVSVAIAGEEIIPWELMVFPVARVLTELIYEGILKERAASMLSPFLDSTFGLFRKELDMYSGNISVEMMLSFINTLKLLGATLSVIEIAFDFVNRDDAIELDESRFIKDKSTFYSTDYREPDSKNDIKRRHSLIAIYDREQKLLYDSNAAYDQNRIFFSPYKRLEFRIKQENAKNILALEDLTMNLYNFIMSKGQKIKKKADSLIGNAVTLTINPYRCQHMMLDMLLSVQYKYDCGGHCYFPMVW